MAHPKTVKLNNWTLEVLDNLRLLGNVNPRVYSPRTWPINTYMWLRKPAINLCFIYLKQVLLLRATVTVCRTAVGGGRKTEIFAPVRFSHEDFAKTPWAILCYSFCNLNNMLYSGQRYTSDYNGQQAEYSNYNIATWLQYLKSTRGTAGHRPEP